MRKECEKMDRTLIDGADVRYDYILFPFDQVPAKSKIILYGAGDIGKILYEQIEKTNYCEVIAFADLAAKGIHFAKKMPPCILPSEIAEYPFDYIVLSKTRGANLIADDLLKLGIEQKKIILLSDRNIIPMEMNRFESYMEKKDGLDRLIECYEKNLSEDEIYAQCNKYIIEKKIFTDRINLLDWYSFEQNKEVLLINETFGILTSYFQGISNRVTVIPENEKYKKLNRLKNAKHHNISYFDTLDETKGQSYDYIIVLGQASWNPDILEQLNRLLKQPTGTLFLAGENKYSFQHWGKMADRNTAGNIFEGIDITEIQSRIEHDFPQYRITTYFPVFSYDCPERIYTKSYLPEFSSMRGNSFTHLDLDVLYDAVAISGTYAHHSDAFLLVIEPAQKDENNLLYLNYKRKRKPELAVLTTIRQENNTKYVYKQALYHAGNRHVLSMMDNQSNLSKVYPAFQTAGIKRVTDNTVQFPFLMGESLDYLLWKQHGNPDIVLDTLLEYSKRMKCINEEYQKEFSLSQEFIDIFGVIDYTGLAIKYGNADAIFDNIIIQDGQWTFFDYEWVFPFFIPMNFPIYRAVEVFLRKYKRYFKKSFVAKVWESIGISAEEQRIYQSMNDRLWKYFTEQDVDRSGFVK